MHSGNLLYFSAISSRFVSQLDKIAHNQDKDKKLSQSKCRSDKFLTFVEIVRQSTTTVYAKIIFHIAYDSKPHDNKLRQIEQTRFADEVMVRRSGR